MKRTEKYFFLSDGGIVKNVEELAFKLDEISDDVFFSHFNEFKNDFAAWVEGCFMDENIINILRSAKNKYDMQVKLLKYLVHKNLLTKKRMFKCKICKKKFSKKVALSVHTTIAHKKKGGEKNG